MNNTNLPPLPPAGAVGPEVCRVIRIYLAVWDDLSDAQRQHIKAHLAICPHCSEERKLLSHSTHLVAGLGESSPSSRVDQAVMAAIAARDSGHMRRPLRSNTRRGFWRPSSLAAVAAVLLVSLLATTLWLTQSLNPQQAFTLPTNLSWNTYVLYSSQTHMSAQGVPYQVNSHRDLGTGRMHVETVMKGKLDVVAVSDAQQNALGKDMMHNVAQWDAHAWIPSEAMFDLNTLRHDLQAKRAVYTGKGSFQGQDVYRIRYSNGVILLLDMHYMPVNVLQESSASNAEKPMYEAFKILPASQVSDTLWDMQVPPGFEMGTLPTKPG